MKYVIFFLIGGILFSNGSASLTFQAHPEHVTLGDAHSGNSLNLTCVFTASPGVFNVFHVAIWKNDSGDGAAVELGRVTVTDPDKVIIDNATLIPRLKVNGHVGHADAFISMEISSLVCSDGSGYFCKAVYLSVGGVQEDDMALEVSVDELPKSVKIRTSPNKSSYHVGDVISLACSGDIGTGYGHHSAKTFWKWESRKSSHTPWKMLSNTPTNRETKIKECSYQGTSSISYTLNDHDVGTLHIRCVAHGVTFTSSQAALHVKPKTHHTVPPTTHKPVLGNGICNETMVLTAVGESKEVVDTQAGMCTDGRRERSEAVVLKFCNAPDVKFWRPGPKVMDNCESIPLHSPIATFSMGVYVENNSGLAGVFLGCSHHGFAIATQVCGHPVTIYHLKHSTAITFVEDPENYHAILYVHTTVKPHLVG